MQETVGWEEVPKGHLLKPDTKSEMAHDCKLLPVLTYW